MSNFLKMMDSTTLYRSAAVCGCLVARVAADMQRLGSAASAARKSFSKHAVTCHSTLDSEKELTDSSRLDPPPDGAFGLGRAFVVVTRGSARRELVFGSVEVVVVVVVVVVEDFVVELGVEDLG